MGQHGRYILKSNQKINFTRVGVFVQDVRRFIHKLESFQQGWPEAMLGAFLWGDSPVNPMTPVLRSWPGRQKKAGVSHFETAWSAPWAERTI
jgi:hypothetical protein